MNIYSLGIIFSHYHFRNAFPPERNFWLHPSPDKITLRRPVVHARNCCVLVDAGWAIEFSNVIPKNHETIKH